MTSFSPLLGTTLLWNECSNQIHNFQWMEIGSSCMGNAPLIVQMLAVVVGGPLQGHFQYISTEKEQLWIFLFLETGIVLYTRLRSKCSSLSGNLMRSNIASSKRRIFPMGMCVNSHYFQVQRYMFYVFVLNKFLYICWELML